MRRSFQRPEPDGSLAKFLTKRQYLNGEKPSSFTPKSPGSFLPELDGVPINQIAEFMGGNWANAELTSELA